MSIRAQRANFRVEKPITRNEIDEEPSVEWVTVTNVMGKIRPMSAVEAQAAGIIYSQASHVIETAHVKGASSKMRIIKQVGGQVFNVNGVVTINRRLGQTRWNCYLEE